MYSTFIEFFVLLSLISHSRARSEHVFLKNIHQKWKYYREGKQEFERFLIFLNIKVSEKSNKIELSENFMAMWRDEQTLWNVISPLCRVKNEKGQKFEKNVR